MRSGPECCTVRACKFHSLAPSHVRSRRTRHHRRSKPSTRGKYLALRREGHWEYAERPNARGAAFIVAVTEAQEIVLVEQYRMPLHARCIELPAGIIGDEAAFAE